MKCTECRKEIESAYFLKGMYAKREDPLVPYCYACKVQLRDNEGKLAFNGVGMHNQSLTRVDRSDWSYKAKKDWDKTAKQLADEGFVGIWGGVYDE